MKSMVRKTKDNSGATIIMALLFMLICVLVSTVLLAAAGTVSRDVSRQREQQQAYLAVSSAMELIKSDIENCMYPQTLEFTSLPVIDGNKEMPFIHLLENGLRADKSGGAQKTEFDLSFTGEEDVSSLDVHVIFEMDENCGISVTCKAEKNDETLYSMTEKFSSKEYKENSENCVWELSSVSKGEG